MATSTPNGYAPRHNQTFSTVATIQQASIGNLRDVAASLNTPIARHKCMIVCGDHYTTFHMEELMIIISEPARSPMRIDKDNSRTLQVLSTDRRRRVP